MMKSIKGLIPLDRSLKVTSDINFLNNKFPIWNFNLNILMLILVIGVLLTALVLYVFPEYLIILFAHGFHMVLALEFIRLKSAKKIINTYIKNSHFFVTSHKIYFNYNLNNSPPFKCTNIVIKNILFGIFLVLVFAILDVYTVMLNAKITYHGNDIIGKVIEDIATYTSHISHLYEMLDEVLKNPVVILAGITVSGIISMILTIRKIFKEYNYYYSQNTYFSSPLNGPYVSYNMDDLLKINILHITVYYEKYRKFGTITKTHTTHLYDLKFTFADAIYIIPKVDPKFIEQIKLCGMFKADIIGETEYKDDGALLHGGR